MSSTKTLTSTWLRRIQLNCSRSKGGVVTISPSIVNDLLEKNLTADKPKRAAAVLVPLCNRHGRASIVFTQRTDAVSTHKGQVSFPGGHLDSGESCIEAAIRECYEELGNNIGNINILGVCQTIPAITGTLVTPIIGYIDRDIDDFQHFQPSEGEVKKVFSHSIEELLLPSFRTEQIFERNGKKVKIPVFNDGADTRIWGLTAMILDGVLKSVIRPTIEDETIGS